MEGEYRGSAEERRDLLGYYKQFKGDMNKARACHALQSLHAMSNHVCGHSSL